MNFPCPTRVDCPGSDSPVINNSSEAPDQLTFLGESYGPNFNPPLGWTWGALSDYSTCESPISQADADTCATNQSIPGTTGSWLSPQQQAANNPSAPRFKNRAQMGVHICPDGQPFLFPIPAGKFTAGTQSAADQAAVDWGNQQANLHSLCLSDLTSPVCQGVELGMDVFAASAFLAPPGVNHWSVSTLPPGLAFNASNTGPATITGTPTTPGIYDFVIGISLPNGDTTSKEYFFTVAGCTNGGSLPQGQVGVAYSAALIAVGFSNPEFGITDTPLPDGLQLNLDGTITGTPTTADPPNTQPTPFTFVITDGLTGFSCSQEASIAVQGGLNFNQLVWTIGQNQTVGGGTTSHTNVGATASATATCVTANPSAGIIEIDASLPAYTGPDVPCTIKITGTLGGNSNGQDYQCTVFQDGNQLFNVDLTANPKPNGTYNFTVLAGVGSLITITLTVTQGRLFLPAIAGSCQLAIVVTPAH